MTVVSNTSPVSNLAMIGRLWLLRSQFDHVLIPKTVDQELAQLADAGASEAIRAAKADGWLEVVEGVRSPLVRVFEEHLDPGEASALACALERGADLVLMDESDGREIASAAGLRVRGVLGILRQAKQTGEVSSLRDELQKLRVDAHFFISPHLMRRFLEASGEA